MAGPAQPITATAVATTVANSVAGVAAVAGGRVGWSSRM
jgi:hypothetical protein